MSQLRETAFREFGRLFCIAIVCVGFLFLLGPSSRAQDHPENGDETNPGKSVFGVVVDEQGTPIEGVKIQAASPVQGYHSSFSTPTGGDDLPGKTTVTDAEGSFRIDGIVQRGGWMNVKDGKHACDASTSLSVSLDK